MSADTYSRMLCLISARLDMRPEEIVTTAKEDPDALRARFTRCAVALKRAGWLDTSISKGFLMVKAYLKYRHVNTDVFPRLSSATGETLQNERTPAPEELGVVLDKLSLRGRVIALFMAHGGLRPQVLGSYQAENGLCLRDIPELIVKDKTIEFRETPFLVRVPAALSKTRASYTTFGTSQLATALLAYLGVRRDGGEALGPGSPVIAALPTRGAARVRQANGTFSNGFLTTAVLTREIHVALSSSVPDGVTWRPYVLRAYCSTRLLMAEGNGRISRDLREAILGHDTGVAGRYHVGKRWGEELLAEARREYANASEFLETNAQSRMSVANEFRRTLLAVAGLNEEEMAKHMEDTNDEVLTLVREKLRSKGAAAPPPPNGNGEGRRIQKPVPLAEARELMAQGWTFVANFGSDEIILQPP
ncbi:MAG: hypothetical protein ACREDK_06170 [Thermoplasmata archaeon]